MTVRCFGARRNAERLRLKNEPFASGLLPHPIALFRRSHQGEPNGVSGEEQSIGSDLEMRCRFTANPVLETTAENGRTRSAQQSVKARTASARLRSAPLLYAYLATNLEAHTSQRGFVLENTKGNPLDIDALARKVIRSAFAATGLTWKGYYGGRRGAETEMNRTPMETPRSHRIISAIPKRLLMRAHYIKPLPDKTKTAAIALDMPFRRLSGD